MGSGEGHVFLEEHMGERHWFFMLAGMNLFVPLLFLLVFEGLGVWTVFEGTVMGGLAWIVAFSLRAPLGLTWERIRQDPWRMIGFGPLKQGALLLLLALTSRFLPWAVSVGLGWITADAVWSIWDGSVALNPKVALEDREAWLRGSFTSQVSQNRPPQLGTLELFLGSTLQMGLILLLQASPWWILFTAPVQGLASWGKAELSRRSVPLALALSGAVGAAVFLFGWFVPMR